jgi:hypothetical protein
MYSRTVSALTAPTDETKDDDHRVGKRDVRCGNSARSIREVNPLYWFATYDADAFGACLTNRWTWSGITSSATTSPLLGGLLSDQFTQSHRDLATDHRTRTRHLNTGGPSWSPSHNQCTFSTI